MMRYRAKLTEPGNTTAERPVQIFGTDRAVIDEWVEKVLAKSSDPDAVVEVFETTETRISVKVKIKAPKRAEVPAGAPKP